MEEVIENSGPNEAAPVAEVTPDAAPLNLGDGFEPVELEGEPEVVDKPEAEVQPPEVEPDKPAETKPAVKAQRLPQLRKEDGSLDEDLIEQFATGAKQSQETLDHFKQRYENNKKFRLAYIEDCLERGATLTPAQQSEWDAQKATTEKKPEEKKAEQPTPAQVRGYILKQIRSGEKTIASHGQAFDTDGRLMLNSEGQPITTLSELQWDWARTMERRHIEEPAQAAAEKARQAEAETREKTQQTVAQAAQARKEFSDAATDWKDSGLFKADPKAPTGFWITDPKVGARMKEIYDKGFGGTISELTGYALYTLKRHIDQRQTSAKASTKSPIQNIKHIPAKAKLPDHLEEVEFEN